MSYLVLLEDEVAAEAARFRGARLIGWRQCIAEIEREPWPRMARDFRIVEEPAADPSEPDDLFLVADWFADIIKYHARDFTEEDPTSRFQGEVRIVGLVGFDRIVP